MKQNELLKKIYGYSLTQAIAVAVKLKLPDLIPQSGSALVEDVAIMISASVLRLNRLFSFLIAHDIFERAEDDGIKHNECSLLLCKDNKNSLCNIALLHGGAFYWDMWQLLLEGIKSDQSCAKLCYGVDVFDYFDDKKNSENKAIFNDAMTNLSAMDANAFVECYSMNSVKSVVDIAGGNGTLIRRIKQQQPTIACALFEQHSVLRELSLPDVECIPGNFFDNVPADFDLYLMRHILHNWDDEKVTSILKTIRNNMRDDSTLCVLEFIADSDVDKEVVAFRDMMMMVAMPSGRERTLAEYKKLFNDSGFTISSISQLPSGLSIMECH